MSEREWDIFFALLKKIIDQPGSWKEKRDDFLKRAERSNADFEEFIGWYGGETTFED